uniref:Ribosomal RNA methyltransferase FtsJ domain-containing protein n=1 Tax=viral metagenome TaxID=1070528 RepID=A0A6C0JKV0_9ZZZZ
MTYYLLPKTSYLIHKHIDYMENKEIPIPVISNSLAMYLYNMKEKLDKKEKDWDIFKKYTNPYEYIHTQLSYKKKSISKHKPLSRSYFKMVEIINTFDLVFDSRPINSFHLAEGPGGFIEALVELRKCQHDKYVGMTILDELNDPSIPGWKKSETFLKQNKNVFIEKAADNTGNILSLDNYNFCRNKYGSTMDFITADGGFDFSLDFNKQEINIAKLLFGQIAYAISMQKKGGCFVLKMFDTFMQHSIDLLYILSSFYDKVYIIKPHTSRYANSEKYIVCKGFTDIPFEQYSTYIEKTFENMLSSSGNLHIHRFLNLPISMLFSIKLEEYNAIFGQQQIENIHYTIMLIDNKHKQDKIDSLINTNIQKCIMWCTKYNIPYNQITYHTNIFLDGNTTTDV